MLAEDAIGCMKGSIMQTQEMHKLNRLLSGEPGPSIQEKEEMLRSILEQVCPAEEGAARGKIGRAHV